VAAAGKEDLRCTFYGKQLTTGDRSEDSRVASPGFERDLALTNPIRSVIAERDFRSFTGPKQRGIYRVGSADVARSGRARSETCGEYVAAQTGEVSRIFCTSTITDLAEHNGPLSDRSRFVETYRAPSPQRLV